MTAMLVEEALVQILRQNAELAALVGNRIYPVYLVQRTDYPAVYYEQRDETEEILLQSPGACGMVRAEFEMISVSKGVANIADCKRTADAVRQALIGFAGGTVVDSADASRSIQIQKIFPSAFGNDQDFEPETQTYRFARTFNVWAIKAIPT